ncbi:hypothetical protein Tco_1451507 [Tanacetum coccineum]
MSARIAEAAALSPSSFRKRYRSSYETPSPSSSPILPIRKRYRGTSELVEDTEEESLDSDTKREGSVDEGLGSDDEGHGLEDKGPSSEEEEEKAAPEGQQQEVLVVDTAVDKPLDPEDGRVYTDIPTYVPPTAPIQTPPSPEWSSGSLPVSPSSPVVPSPIASPVTTPAATISVDEDQFLEVGAQLELHGSILHDHTHHLDALPPTLFRSLEREQERAMMTFSAIWRRQIAEERCERFELTDHVARMERRQESREE